MASGITLENPTTGQIKNGYYGFSWTTLFFGFFPALFRGDYSTFIGVFVVCVILGMVTAGIGSCIAMFVWAFMYNKYYTNKPIAKGFRLAGSQAENVKAASKLGIRLNANNSTNHDL
ncbi:hypothetical protein [Enterobacter kobei]